MALTDRSFVRASPSASGMRSTTAGTAAPIPTSRATAAPAARSAGYFNFQNNGHKVQTRAAAPTLAIICAAGPVRVCHRRSSDAARAGTVSSEDSPKNVAVAPPHPGEEQPSNPAGDRQSDDEGRDSPAVPIDRPCLLHMAQPQLLDLGRDMLRALKALRPCPGVKADDHHAAASASARRRFQSPGESHASAYMQSAAEQCVGEPDRRQCVADGAAIVVGGEQKEAECGPADERDGIGAQPLALFALVRPRTAPSRRQRSPDR